METRVSLAALESSRGAEAPPLHDISSVHLSYFSAHWTIPLGVALLLAAVGGVLLAAIVASLRIWQLRHRLNQAQQPQDAASSQVPPAQEDPGEQDASVT